MDEIATAAKLAVDFYVEQHGKEFWLVKRTGKLVDAWVEFRNEKVNIPFCPHVLVAKYDLKSMDTVLLLKKAWTQGNPYAKTNKS